MDEEVDGGTGRFLLPLVGRTGSYLSLCLAVTLVLVLGGCGATREGPAVSAEDFSEAYRRATDSYKLRTEAAQAQARRLRGQETEKLVTVFASMREAAREARKDFRRLEPPPSVREPFARSVDLLDAQLEALDKVIAGAQAGDSAAVGGALQRLVRSLADWSRTNHQITRQISPNGGMS